MILTPGKLDAISSWMMLCLLKADLAIDQHEMGLLFRDHAERMRQHLPRGKAPHPQPEQAGRRISYPGLLLDVR